MPSHLLLTGPPTLASPSAFRPGEFSRAPLVHATLVSNQPVATDWLRAPTILRARHPGFHHACQRSSHSLVPALLLPFTDFSPPPSTALFPGARAALALRPTHHSGLLPYQSYTARHNRGCAECIPPYLTSNSLAYVMHARLRLLAMRPHVTRHGLPQVRGVCCLCHLALPMYACRRLNLPRSHLARLNLACLTPGSARCYADRPSPLSPHLLNRRGAQSAAICASSAPLPTDLTRHAALRR